MLSLACLHVSPSHRPHLPPSFHHFRAAQEWQTGGLLKERRVKKVSWAQERVASFSRRREDLHGTGGEEEGRRVKDALTLPALMFPARLSIFLLCSHPPSLLRHHKLSLLSNHHTRKCTCHLISADGSPGWKHQPECERRYYVSCVTYLSASAFEFCRGSCVHVCACACVWAWAMHAAAVEGYIRHSCIDSIA